MMAKIRSLFAAFLLLLIFQSMCFAEETSIPTINEIVSPAVVSIQAGNSTGSGFFVSPAGYLLTNAHVVKEHKSVTILLANGRSLPGEVIARGAQDFAIVKVNNVNAPVVRLASAKGVKQGEPILILGSPKGLANSISRGIVSHMSRQIEGIDYIQLDAALNPGNSGGPVVNMKGEVIGIATMTLMDAQGIGFVLPIDTTFPLLKEKGIFVNTNLTDEDLALQSMPAEKALPMQFPPGWRDMLHTRWVAGGLAIFAVLLGVLLYRKLRCRKAVHTGVSHQEQDVDITLTAPQKAAASEDNDLDIKLH